MRQSQLFTKTTKDVSKDEVSTNAKLLIRAGFIDKLMAGVYTFLPLGFRVFKKIEQIIREEMNKVGAQEVLMPALQPKSIWDKTSRWDEDVMFHMKSQTGKEYGLGFTHEEVVTPLVGKFVQSYKDLPVSVYQIQTKFRDELRSKSGLLRGREFVMKDMYSFHANEQDLLNYYEVVRKAYFEIFDRCGIKEYTKYTFASGGSFCDFSHEFQALTEAGEDLIRICQACGVAVNKEVYEQVDFVCPDCKGTLGVEEKAIEVANIFKLNTRFSKTFGVSFIDENGKKQDVLMGCYGIGVGRLMGAIVEMYNDNSGIIWPLEMAPYQIHLLSIGDDDVKKKADVLYQQLGEDFEILYDDRSVSAGTKFKDCDLIGIPVRLVVSNKTTSRVEIKYRNSSDIRFLKSNILISELLEYYS